MGGWRLPSGFSWALPQPVQDTVQAQGRTPACPLFPSPRGLPVGQRVRGWGWGKQGAEPDSRTVADRPPLLLIHTGRTQYSSQSAALHPVLTRPPSSCPVLMPASPRKPFPQLAHHTSRDSQRTFASTSCGETESRRSTS